MSEPLPDELTIIGIGSSAGGLEAVRELVATLPTDVPVSYIVVQHMSPTHKSLMTELVARQTNLQVKDVTSGTKPQPNVVYITPPNTDVLFMDGKLQLVDPSKEVASPKPSVDRFLLSLAENHGANSMAMILSGTGSDGAYGVQAIREAGGITIAQDAESAKYDGMPVAAIQTGCIDLVLRPLDIGKHLQKILSQPRDFSSFRSGGYSDSPVSDLLQILLARTRVDFREYKQTTINRRIERRMLALGIDSQEEYTQFCRNNPQAVDALFKDLLISVTRFFRDKAEFEHLEQMLPQLIKERDDDPLRIWVAGCATGEEAYSIAMLVSEAMGGPGPDLKSKVQIFATDIDKDALKVARKGVYGTAALNDIPQYIAEKYIILQNDGVRVVENLRNAILFSDHNVCQDPPFQKVDLICCRNLLIYFGNALQRKIMSRFHYSMTQHALMFLGTAESVAGSDDLFAQDRSAAHIYRKRVLHPTSHLPYNMPNPPVRKGREADKPSTTTPSTDRQLFEALAQSLGKNSVLVTDDYAIARVYGNISPFIEMNDKTNLRMHLDLLRSPLREEARSLITIALKNGSFKAGVRHLLAESDEQEIRLDVYPIIAREINERAALLVFTPVKVDRAILAKDVIDETADGAVTERIQHLENEVATTREALQQTIEELETSNEELQSLNEELQSTNEELQATNEELETSNEELQSTNEELITVNEELQVTTSELSGRTGELTSVLESTPVPIVVVDNALQITQATQYATELFEIQRPISTPHISQCALPDGFPSLAPLCSEALRLGETITKEFNSGGTRIRLSCSPYFDRAGKILGVTIVVTDFPGLSREMEMILETSNIYLMHRNKNGDILRASRPSAEALGHSREELVGKNIRDLVDQTTAEQLIAEDREFLAGDASYVTSQIQVTTSALERPKWLSLNRYKFSEDGSDTPTVYSVATDITATVTAHENAQALLGQIRALHGLAGVGYWEFNVRDQTLFWSTEVYRIHRVSEQDYTPSIATGVSFYHPDDADSVRENVERVLTKGGEFDLQKRLICADGTEIQVEAHGIAVHDLNGDITGLVGVFREMSF